MNYIEFTVLKAFTSEFKLQTNPVKAFNGMCVRLTSITLPVINSCEKYNIEIQVFTFTVITPFFPTFFMADEIRSPTPLSPFAEIVAT